MRTILIICPFLAITVMTHAQSKKTLYDFQATTIDGQPVDLSIYKGEKVLVVNVASKCGYTPQYAQLEELFKKYSVKNFVIIGFPANNFMSQEPGTNAEIKEFCTSKYQVTFPMMAKISVKGKDIDPLYAWLTSKDENGVLDAPVKWNFQKFMINEQGQVVDFAAPGDKPFDNKIVDWIEKK
jgi:glutathione peroxidase